MVGVTTTIAATAGIEDSEQGLASGVLSTSQQIGCALGLAILIAVAATRTDAIAAQIGTSAIAIVEGFQAALTVGAGFAAIGILIAIFVKNN